MEPEHQAQCPASADARAILSSIEGIGGLCFRARSAGERQRAGLGSTEEQQITAEIGTNGKRVAQVHVEARGATDVEAMRARLVRCYYNGLETTERSVARTQGEVRFDTPHRNVHARLGAQGPQLPIGKIGEAKARPESERQQAHA